jgi:hypothetical protein
MHQASFLEDVLAEPEIRAGLTTRLDQPSVQISAMRRHPATYPELAMRLRFT